MNCTKEIKKKKKLLAVWSFGRVIFPFYLSKNVVKQKGNLNEQLIAQNESSMQSTPPHENT